MIEPKEKRAFTDFSDYPQNGFGVKDVDRDYSYFPDRDEIEENEVEEIEEEKEND